MGYCCGQAVLEAAGGRILIAYRQALHYGNPVAITADLLLFVVHMKERF